MTEKSRFFSNAEIRALARRSDLMGIGLLVHCYGIMALALVLFSLWPNPVSFVLAIMVIGSRQLGLAILMHDAAHRALFKTGKLNDFVGGWLCGAPILADLYSYRHYHLTHHRFTQTEDDPDIGLAKPFPTTRASLMRKFFRDLTGQTGIKQMATQIRLSLKLAGDVDAVKATGKQAQAFKGGGMAAPLLANGVIFAVLWSVGDWWWFPVFWLLPLLTWFQLVLRIRNIAEHGATEFTDNPLRNVRTTRAGPVLGLLLAPYWVNYHLEHHLVMHVPCFRLKKMHAMMLAKGHGGDMRVARNYGAVLAKVGWSR